VLLWHGGGMTGANWEGTPDGRPGWLTLFLGAGFDVYVSDAVERGRAGWSRWPEIYARAPLFRTLEEGWDLFRLGAPQGYSSQAQARQPHAGQQFPVAHFDQFAAQWVPRWAGHEEITMRAYGELLAQVGPCVVIGHSQGGGFALDAARRWPELVRAVIAVEPSGAPAFSAPPEAAPAQPHLVLWGDYIAEHALWRSYRATVDAYLEARRATGLHAETLDLPRAGVQGNSHFPMLDGNSNAIGQMIIDWLARQSL
jgi:pimeloyl-ACP methyl ester carboxylesterase